MKELANSRYHVTFGSGTRTKDRLCEVEIIASTDETRNLRNFEFALDH